MFGFVSFLTLFFSKCGRGTSAYRYLWKERVTKGSVANVSYTAVCYYGCIFLSSLMLLIINIPCIPHSLRALSHVCSERLCSHRLPLTAIVRDRHFSAHSESVYWIHKQETASQKQISAEPSAQMSDFRSSLPEAHESHNGLFLVLIINIGGEGEEDENVAPAKKQLPSTSYILTYEMCYFQRNKERNLPQTYRFFNYASHEVNV